MSITLEQLFIHPIKSMQGLTLPSADVELSGLAGDRQFMLTEPDGRFITARQYHTLLRLRPTQLADGIKVTAPNQDSIVVNYADFSSQLETTLVWGNQFASHIASIRVNRWFSHYLGKDVQLRWLGPQLYRRVKHYPQLPLSFADGYPFLLINIASYQDVAKRMQQPLNIAQFRGNIIINGAPAYSEDHWRKIQIGEVIFELVKPCSRCILTTIDAATAQANADQEPLTTLSQYRRDDQGDIDFGVNMIATQAGSLRLRDRVTVLATKPAKIYCLPNRQTSTLVKSVEPELTPKPVRITYQNQTFIGNQQQVLLEQLEQHGVNIDYSCRAGLCGRCRLTLKRGEVSPLTGSAIRRNQQILTCSCTPKSDIELA